MLKAVLLFILLSISQVWAQTGQDPDQPENFSQLEDTLDQAPGEDPSSADLEDANVPVDGEKELEEEGFANEEPESALESTSNENVISEDTESITNETMDLDPEGDSLPAENQGNNMEAEFNKPIEQEAFPAENEASMQEEGAFDSQPESMAPPSNINKGNSPSDFSQSPFPSTGGQQNFGDTLIMMNPSTLNRKYYKAFIYRSDDRRDPFMPIIPRGREEKSADDADPLSALQEYDVSQLTVTAVIWNTNRAKALVRDPQNNTFTVQENDPIGRNNGYIESIREGEVVVVESRELKSGELFYTTQILRVGR